MSAVCCQNPQRAPQGSPSSCPPGTLFRALLFSCPAQVHVIIRDTDALDAASLPELDPWGVQPISTRCFPTKADQRPSLLLAQWHQYTKPLTSTQHLVKILYYFKPPTSSQVTHPWDSQLVRSGMRGTRCGHTCRWALSKPSCPCECDQDTELLKMPCVEHMHIMQQTLTAPTRH